MEEDDDLFLVIIENENDEIPMPVMIKQEPGVNDDHLDVNDIIKTAEKHGQLVDVDLKSALVGCEYLEPEEDNEYTPQDKEYTGQNEGYTRKHKDNVTQPKKYKFGYTFEDEENIVQEEDFTIENESIVKEEEYIPQDEDYAVLEEDTAMEEEYLDEEEKIEKARKKMLEPKDQRSFVKDLRDQYPELKRNRKKLINTLCEIMRNVQVPKPPDGFYIQDGADIFMCTKCDAVTESLPAAGRHYQEKHGLRYLICYACGVDFRSKTNLYKHEKRCTAPDAHIVLKARAISLGNKARSRPYLHMRKSTPPTVAQSKFSCTMCSAKFFSNESLMSHEYLHRGERPFQCHTCPAAYTSNSALLRHMKTHSDEKYICDKCSRVFKIKAALVAHMGTHEPIRKHGCPECPRRFAQKSAMQLHVDRVHRNLPPPCACQICPKRFPRMSLLKIHMKNEHGFIIMTRKMFFKKLPLLSSEELEYYAKLVFKEGATGPETKNSYFTEDSVDEGHDNEFVVPHDLSADDFVEYLKKLQYQGNENIESKVFVIKNGKVTNLKTEIEDIDC